MTYIPRAECMAMFPHEAHSWREGFLWRNKMTCKGITQESIETLYREIYPPGWEKKANPAIGERIELPEAEPPVHKHALKLLKLPFIRDDYVVLNCMGCGDLFSTVKEPFYKVLKTTGPNQIKLKKTS